MSEQGDAMEAIEMMPERTGYATPETPAPPEPASPDSFRSPRREPHPRYGERPISFPYHDTADAAGALTVHIPGPPQGYFWEIKRLTVEGPTTGDAVSVYLDSVVPGNLLDQTDQWPAVSDGTYFIGPEQDIVLVFTGLAPDLTVSVRVQAYAYKYTP